MTPRALRLLLLASLLAACQVSSPPSAQPSALERTPSPRAAVAAATPEPIVDATERPAATASPTPIPTPSPTLAPPTEFAFNLFEEGDFVPQYTFEWCVGASIQMAHNLVEPERRTAPEDQAALWEQARARSSNSFNGANPLGWAAVLTDIGLGPYQVVSIADFEEALRVAAAAIHDTGRPVGLVIWRGRHAWVMSGFESIGDPAIHPDFQVTGVRVLDPLHPYGSSTWGPSPEPNSLLSPAAVAEQFVIREPRRWSTDLGAGYLLVLPTAEERSAG